MKKILVRFTNGKEVIYTDAIFELLMSDSDTEVIIDCETGEILYMKE